MQPVRPKKNLGQHFLADHNIAKKIVGSLSQDLICPVIEIGPGTGILTEYLSQNSRQKLYLIEIDTESIEFLSQKYPTLKDSIIHADILSYDINNFEGNEFVLIGNLPYNISSQIFFKILDNKNKIRETVCMIQKEVAERISAPPGSKTYGILSVLLQAFFKIDYLFSVSEKVFIPPPKVKSAVIKLTRNDTKELGCDEKLFFRIVKATFNQRRKTISNSIKPIVDSKAIVENPFMTNRPEQLSVNDFVALTKLVEAALSDLK